MRGFDWTDEALAIIKEMYPDNKTSLIAERLGVGIGIVYRKANELGLKKSEAFNLSYESGRINKLTLKGEAFRFKKGNVPMNKGRKQIEYMPIESIERTSATRFKKGNVPFNKKDVGTERISKYGYIEMNTGNGYVLKHRHIWETNMGPIPKGMIIGFKDGNKLNLELSNLELLTMKENMLRNSIQRFPAEVIDAIKLVSKLNKKLKKYGNKEQN